MNCWRTAPLLVGLLVLAPACQERGPSVIPNVRQGTAIAQARQRATAWLKSQQAEDGGWHSNTYGPMRGGAGNTALVVYALSLLPAEEQQPIQLEIERGLRFLLSNLDAAGHVRTPDGSADYPTYATALTLSALVRVAPSAWIAERTKMQSYLLQSQVAVSNAATQDDLECGGWNQTGGSVAKGAGLGDTNISVTSFALEALHLSGALKPNTAAAALRYLSSCQNLHSQSGDGGFFFTPRQDDPRNKAGTVDPHEPTARAKSYETATLDGLTSLAMCGAPVDDPRFAAAALWLTNQREAAGASTKQASSDQSPLDGLRYYRYVALSRCRRAAANAPVAHELHAAVATLLAEQQRDGSWQNCNSLMREDDPLIATALALSALADHDPARK